MAISVQVPKDLSGIKTKVALNLTKRQIICFSGAAVAGIPLYFLTKGLIGTSAASLLMMGAMLPFFFFAMYEKNGFPAEKILYFMLRQKILTPGIRPYRSENLYKQLEEKEKAFRLARKTAREVEERKAKQNVRGEKAALKKGIPRIMMGNLKNHAENSTGKLNNIHIQKSEKIRQEVMDIRNSLSQTDKLKTDFNASALHTGKILVTAQNINFHYPDSNTNLWTVPLSFQLRSGNRFCIKGDNGSGKTTLLRLITGELTPTGGTIERADFTYVYLDQEYSLIQNEYTVSEQAEAFNLRHLPEHEIKTVLNRYLFPQDVWNKPCGKLSGGEKMRLAFCCLMIADNTPDLFILDEPTNNLDIESIEIITATIRNYQGTVLAVSHDRDFLKETGIEQEISFFL